MNNIELLNAISKTKRKDLSFENNFNINELSQMPELFDWVNCDVGVENKFYMFLGGKDDGVALRFFWNGSYEKYTLKTWSELAKKTKGFALDIGAHTGCYSLAALSANKNLNVLSFEPHYINFARLILNFNANKFNINNIFMCCVGDENKFVPFSTFSRAGYLTTGGSVGHRSGATVNSIPQVALDSFLIDEVIQNINLIKIDVEGYEANVLKGMKKILGLKPTIFFECIEKNSAKLTQEILSSYGYIFFEIDDLTGKITKVKNLEPQLSQDNKLVMHKLNRIASINENF
jgi:FkbM family methyltransferase